MFCAARNLIFFVLLKRKFHSISVHNGSTILGIRGWGFQNGGRGNHEFGKSKQNRKSRCTEYSVSAAGNAILKFSPNSSISGPQFWNEWPFKFSNFSYFSHFWEFSHFSRNSGRLRFHDWGPYPRHRVNHPLGALVEGGWGGRVWIS